MYKSTISYNLEKGTYFMVVDNTNYGSIDPPMNFSDDVIILNLKIQFKYNE